MIIFIFISFQTTVHDQHDGLHTKIYSNVSVGWGSSFERFTTT